MDLLAKTSSNNFFFLYNSIEINNVDTVECSSTLRLYGKFLMQTYGGSFDFF